MGEVHLKVILNLSNTYKIKLLRGENDVDKK
jgi:hypothetical protein